MNQSNDPWEVWQNAVGQSAGFLKHGLLQLEFSLKEDLNALDKKLLEKIEDAVENCGEEIKRMKEDIQKMDEKIRQRVNGVDRELEQRIEIKVERKMQKKVEDFFKNMDARIQEKIEEKIHTVEEETKENMMETLHILEGGNKQAIKDEIQAMEEKTLKAMKEAVYSMEVKMPEKVEQVIQTNDKRMRRMEDLVRSREHRAHDILRKVEESFVTNNQKVSERTFHSPERNKEHKPENTEYLEKRISKLETFVQTSVDSIFLRMDSLISQIERTQKCSSSSYSSFYSASDKQPADGNNAEKYFRNAAKEGEISEVRELLSRGVNINCHNSTNGITALHWAAKSGHADIVKLLVDGGAEVNKTDIHCQTPLHLAVEKNRVKCASLLIEAGADLEKQDEFGWTPLHIAANCGHEVTVRMLVEKGSDLAVRNRSGETPLNVAFKEATRRLLREYLDHRSEGSREPLSSSRDGNTWRSSLPGRGTNMKQPYQAYSRPHRGRTLFRPPMPHRSTPHSRLKSSSSTEFDPDMWEME